MKWKYSGGISLHIFMSWLFFKKVEVMAVMELQLEQRDAKPETAVQDIFNYICLIQISACHMLLVYWGWNYFVFTFQKMNR